MSGDLLGHSIWRVIFNMFFFLPSLMMLQFLLAYFLIISSRDLKSSSLFLSFRCGDTVAMTQKLVCKIISVMSVWHYQISSFFFQYYVYLLHFFHLLGYLTSEWLHTDLATVRSGLTWTSCSEATQCHERKSPGARYSELPNRWDGNTKH